MLAAPELIVRASEIISPTLVEKPQLREVFESLIRDDSGASQMPDGLSEEGAAAWSYLKEAGEKLSGQEVLTLFDQAAQILQARSQYREMTTIADPGEKQRKRAELRALFPAADEWYKYYKAAARYARDANPSRGS